MISGLIVYLWHWNYADAIVSILVSLYIGREAIEIVKGTVNVLMEGTPKGLEFADVEQAMLGVPEVKGVHDLHIWSISSNDLALSAHVEIADAVLSQSSTLVASLKDMLAQRFGVGHATLELEAEGGECSGSCEIPRVQPASDERRRRAHRPGGRGSDGLQ